MLVHVRVSDQSIAIVPRLPVGLPRVRAAVRVSGVTRVGRRFLK